MPCPSGTQIGRGHFLGKCIKEGYGPNCQLRPCTYEPVPGAEPTVYQVLQTNDLYLINWYEKKYPGEIDEVMSKATKVGVTSPALKWEKEVLQPAIDEAVAEAKDLYDYASGEKAERLAEQSAAEEQYFTRLEALGHKEEEANVTKEALKEIEKCGRKYVQDVADLQSLKDKLFSETSVNGNSGLITDKLKQNLRSGSDTLRAVTSGTAFWKRHTMLAESFFKRVVLAADAGTWTEEQYGLFGFKMALEESLLKPPSATDDALIKLFGVSAYPAEHAPYKKLYDRGQEGIFFPAYDNILETAHDVYLSTPHKSPPANTPGHTAASIGFYLTLINYYLAVICQQINIAQNLNGDDLNSGKLHETAIFLAANDFSEGSADNRRYYPPDSLLPLVWGTVKVIPNTQAGGGDGTDEADIFFDLTGKWEKMQVAKKLALFNTNTNIIKLAQQCVNTLASSVDEATNTKFHLAAIRNFLANITSASRSAGKQLVCIRDAWNTVINTVKENEAERKALAEELGVTDQLKAVSEFHHKQFIKGGLLTNLEANMYRRNPAKLFFKEQCFLLSYIGKIASTKKQDIDKSRSRGEIDNTAASDLAGDLLIGGFDKSIEFLAKYSKEDSGLRELVKKRDAKEAKADALEASTNGKKLLPYIGYSGRWANSYGVNQNNSTLLLDGDPYGFLNKLVNGDQKELMNIDHTTLSLLQPFIRLYKVEFDDDGLERDTEIKFDSYRTSNEEKLFKTDKLRNSGVGLKNFTFTYDGSNPFGAKKSIKGQLKIFANTFDELLDQRGNYRYVDLALKTFNKGTDKIANNSRQILKENQNLAKLNFRLKAQVGWSTPDVATLDRMGLSEKKLSRLRANLFDSVVTLNLTPTVHDFEFDELGRVNFTINYLAYVEETYSQAKFNVFSEAEFAAAREIRSLKLDYYSQKCKPEAMSKLKKEYAIKSADEVSESISNLVTSLIELDRIYYIDVTQDEIKRFISEGPFGIQWRDIKVNSAGGHQHRLKKDIDIALAQYKKQVSEDEFTEHKTKISTALATTNPSSTVVSFFYLSDLVDTILANIEREIQLIPEKLEDSDADVLGTELDIATKIKEYKSYQNAFKKLRFILGPVEFVSPISKKPSIFVNLGDIPVSVRYWFEWLTSTMLDRGKSFYSLTSFMNDFINRMISQFLNNSDCFGYNIRQNVNMQQVSYTGPQIASEVAKKTSSGFVVDPITSYCVKNSVYRTNIDNLTHPVLRGPGGAYQKIKASDEVNYMVYFVGRTAPTEKMLGTRSIDEELGIYHYQIGRDKGVVKDISLKKTSTPGLQEVRFEQQGFDGLEQLRVTYDAGIKCYAHPNTFPGTYIYVDPAGFSPSAKVNKGIDLTKYGVGGYYMIIRSTHNFAPGTATTDIEAKWVNSLHTGDDGLHIQNSYGGEETAKSDCTLDLRAEGVKEA